MSIRSNEAEEMHAANRHETKIREMLRNGQEPTVDDLSNALVTVIQERDTYRQITKDMGKWLSKLVAAHVLGDDDNVKETLGEFMEKHVMEIRKTEERVH